MLFNQFINERSTYFVIQTTAVGKMGPKNKPSILTETAETYVFGTSQKRSSKRTERVR